MAITIKAARVNARLTIKQVADELNTSKNTIASYEAYKTSPTVTTAEKLAKLFGLGINEIKWSKE